jgi:hypothetical protein
VIFFPYVGDVFEVVGILEGHRDLEAWFKQTRPLTEPHATPSFFCRLVDEVVYWNVSFLSGYT